jgi:hypothetical protein
MRLSDYSALQWYAYRRRIATDELITVAVGESAQDTLMAAHRDASARDEAWRVLILHQDQVYDRQHAYRVAVRDRGLFHVGVGSPLTKEAP